MRGGQLNQSGFGERMRGNGAEAELLTSLFTTSCLRTGLSLTSPGTLDCVLSSF